MAMPRPTPTVEWNMPPPHPTSYWGRWTWTISWRSAACPPGRGGGSCAQGSGLAARGVVFGIIGYYLVRARYRVPRVTSGRPRSPT